MQPKAAGVLARRLQDLWNQKNSKGQGLHPDEGPMIRKYKWSGTGLWDYLNRGTSPVKVCL